jgi:hypothetical protein
MMKTTKVLCLALVGLAVLVVLISYFIWVGYPKKNINIYVLDKTVPDFSYSKHRSLFWVLNNSRIMQGNGDNYNVSDDYYGFQPLKPLSDCQYEIRHISLEQIDSLSNAYDVAYYADTRGVYFNEWFRGFRQRGENSVIEGGLNQNDFLFLKAMKDKGKLIINEYNTLSTPTSDLIGFKTEELYGIHTTGWAGKYFESLDSTNTDIPLNLISLYERNNDGQWPFTGKGIILFNINYVIVLQMGVHINAPLPVIISDGEKAKQLQLPEKIDYYNWFEMVSANDTTEIISNYQLNMTSTGDSLLMVHGLKPIFPAIISYDSCKIHTCYFAGDFATNSVITPFARLANSRKLIKLFTIDKEKLFFQQYYFPLIENLLIDYSKELDKNKATQSETK